MIVEYLARELSPEAERAFEEDLWAGKLDSQELSELSALVAAVGETAFTGMLTMTVSEEQIAKVRAQGYRLLEVRLEPGVTTVADLSGDFELVLLEYAVDLTGVTRLDCEVCDSDGKPYKRVVDLPVRDGRLRGYCDRELAVTSARMLPRGIINKLYAVDGQNERLLGVFHSIASALPPE